MILQKKMKAFLAMLSAILIAICAGIIIFIISSGSHKEKLAQTYETEQYVVGVYKEKIAIFTQGDSVPIEIFDVYVTTLPPKDQKTLRKGVYVQGKAELKRMIEDYTS